MMIDGHQKAFLLREINEQTEYDEEPQAREMKFTKLLMQMLPTVEPWVVPGENVKNPGGIDNVNPLDTLSSDLHPWGGRVRAPSPCV